MPRIFRDEYRCALLKSMRHIIQQKYSAAFQNVEGLVHLQVSMNGNACTDHHLLRSQREIVRACPGAGLDENLTMVPKMDEVFTFATAEYIPVPPADWAGDTRDPNT